jgi:hypothetical protein
MTIRARIAIGAARAFVLAFGLGALWLARDGMNPDGVAYLDASDVFLEGGWPESGSSYWSPLYPTLLAIGRLLGGTSPGRALAVGQAVNLVLFLLAFAALEWLVRTIRAEAEERTGHAQPNDVAWRLLAYGLFAWCTVGWIRVWLLTPDVGVAAIMFAVAAVSVRLGSGRGRWGSAIVLGALLGAAYLMKAAMLPVGIVVLATLAAVRSRRGFGNSLGITTVAAAVFLAISAPQVAYVSRLKGSPTFSDVGRLTYLWFIAGVPGPVTIAFPLPARLPEPSGERQTLALLGDDDQHPAVYDIDAPIPGTLPIWYDPGHWYRGVVVPFRPVALARVVVRHVRMYLEMFGLLLVGGVAAALAGPIAWRAVRTMRPEPLLVVPALAALAMYGLLLVQARYVAPFAVLLFIGLVPPWAVGEISRRVRIGLATGAVAGLSFVVYDVRVDAAYWGGSAGARASVVAALSERGIGPGARLAFIGEAYDAMWAHQAGIRFVTLLPRAEADRFWSLDVGGRMRILERMQARGATAIVAEVPRPGVNTDGWDQLPSAGPPAPDLLVYGMSR